MGTPSRATVLAMVAAAWLTASPAVAQPGELVERTLALVGSQVITLGDATAATSLSLIDVNGAPDPVAAAAPLLIDRALVLREVQRYAPPDPPDAAIEARVAEVRQKLGVGFARALEITGFSEGRLRAWIRDDLRTQAYLSQRFAAAGAPSEQELSAAFTKQRAEFEQAGLTFEQASPILRERLTAARRRELIDDWVSDLRRRTDVVVLPK